jgi:hypothetical protein
MPSAPQTTGASMSRGPAASTTAAARRMAPSPWGVCRDEQSTGLAVSSQFPCDRLHLVVGA